MRRWSRRQERSSKSSETRWRRRRMRGRFWGWAPTPRLAALLRSADVPTHAHARRMDAAWSRDGIVAGATETGESHNIKGLHWLTGLKAQIEVKTEFSALANRASGDLKN